MMDTTNTGSRGIHRRCNDKECPSRHRCYWGVIAQVGDVDYERKVDAPSCWAFCPSKGTEHYTILQSNRTRGVHPGNRNPEPRRRTFRKGHKTSLLST